MEGQKSKSNIILTADDFGKSENANRNILRLAQAGKLNRVSVMIEGDFGKEDIHDLLSSGIKTDIHFELIWQKRRRNLLKDHTLRQVAVFFVNYLWGDWPVPEHPRSNPREVSKEWKGQIEKFKKIFGRLPDGISSHEHTHFFPPYFKICLEIAKQYKIPFVRFGKYGLRGKSNSVKSILSVMRFFNRRKFAVSGLESSDFFVSLDWIDRLDNFLKNRRSSTSEIACHPERKDEMELIEKFF